MDGDLLDRQLAQHELQVGARHLFQLDLGGQTAARDRLDDREHDYPGFKRRRGRAHVPQRPLDAQFTNTPGGAVYGFAPLPFERGIWAGVPRSPKTPLSGVYLASSFTESGGFTGAMKSGADAARTAMKEPAH